MNFVDVQTQVGAADCGLFALAFATSLCVGDNSIISNVNFVITSNCFQKRAITRFPNRDRLKKAKIHYQTSFKIYCYCRQPEYGKMICCSTCKEWFHKECVKAPAKVWKEKKTDWYCRVCSE